MVRSTIKQATAVAVAFCMGITFIPLAGEYEAFAAEDAVQEGTPAVEEPAAPAGDETVVSEPEQENAEPAADQAVEEPEAAAEADAVTEPAEEEAALEALEGETDTSKNGLINENGATYYYVNGVMQTGVVNINGELYYFFNDGKAVTATNAWFKGDDSTTADRYALGGGKIAAGAKAITEKVKYKKKVKINKKKGKKAKYKTVTKTKNVSTLYWFDKTTGKIRKDAGFFSDGANSYYCKGNGQLAVKWNAIGNKAYYFYPNTGIQAKGTTIGHLKIPASGHLGEAYALGIKKLNKTKWTLRQAYKNSYKIRYQGRWWRQKTAEQYALKGFKKNKGNCYVMASTFYIQAKLLGYNVRQIKGKVAHRYPHSWTQIKTGSKWKVYDPNFRNETGRNGWNIYYGKKGTWRYTNYSVFQN